jgi:hypothetical protein
LNDLTDFIGLPLLPRFHVAPNGALFMSGSLATTYFFENFPPGNPGTWVPIATRSAGNSDYAPSVMYDAGKFIFIGGGAPTNIVEIIDLNASKPAWELPGSWVGTGFILDFPPVPNGANIHWPDQRWRPRASRQDSMGRYDEIPTTGTLRRGKSWNDYGR